MAGASLGTAEGKIIVDASQAIGSINQVGSALNGLDSKTGIGAAAQGMAQMNQQTINLAQGMQHLGRVGVGLGISMAAPFVGAGKAALDFEDSMAGVNAVMNLTAGEFQNLSELASKLGADSIFSGNEAAQGIETLGKAGIEYQDIINGAAQASVDLAAAAGSSVPQAAEVMAAAMAAFNIAGEDSVTVADALAGAANASLTDINQLSLGLGQVGGIAAAANMDLVDTVSYLALMADNGIRGSDAATSMKTAILALLSPTDKAAESMAAMGIELLDTEGNFVGLKGASEQFFDVWKDSGQTMSEFLDPLESVLGRDAVRAILFGMQAIEEGVNGTGKGFEFYEDAASQAGAASEFAEKRMDSTAGAIERLQGSVTSLAEKAGLPLVQAIRGPIEGLDALVDALLNVPAPILGAVTAAGALAAAFVTVGSGAVVVAGYILEGVARLSAAGIAMDSVATAALRVAAVFTGLIALVAGLKIAWDTNFLGFRDTIQGIGDDLQALADKVKFFFEVFKADDNLARSETARNIEAIGQAVKAATGIDITGFTSRLADLVDYLDRVQSGLRHAAKAWERYENNSENVTDLARDIDAFGHTVDRVFGTNISDATDKAADGIDAFAARYSHMIDDLKTNQLAAILAGAGAGIAEIFGSNAVSDALTKMAQVVANLGLGWENAIQNGLNPAAAALQAISWAAESFGATGLAERLLDAANAAQKFGDIFQDIFQTGQDLGINGVSSALFGVAEALEQVFGIDSQPIHDLAAAIDLLSKRWQAAINEGANPFQAALAGIDGFLDSILSNDAMNALDGISLAIQNAATAVGNLLGAGLDRVGQLFSEIGTAISQGDFSGVADAIGSLVEDVSNYDWGTLAQNVADSISTALSGIGDLLGPAADNVGTAIGTAMGTVGSLLGEVDWAGVVSTIGNGIATAFDTVGPWVAGIAGSIANALRDAMGQVGGLIGGIDWNGVVSSIGDAIATAFNTVGPWVASIAGSIADGIRDALGEVGNLIGSIDWSAVISTVGTSISSAFSTAGTWLTGVTNTIRTQLESAIGKAGETAVDLGDWMLNVGIPQLDGVVRDFSGWIQQELSNLVNNVGTITEDFTDWAINLVIPEGSDKGVVLDSASFTTLVGGAIVEALTTAATSLSSGVDQQKIGEVSANVGAALGELVFGILTTAVANLPELVSLPGTFYATLTNVVGSFVKGFFDAFNKALETALTTDAPQGGRPGGAAGATATSIGDNLVNSLNAMIDGFLSAIPDVMGAIPNKIIEAMGIENPFTGIKEQIDTWINEAFPSTPDAAGGVGQGGAPAAAVQNLIGGYEQPINQGIENGNLRLIESANRKLAEGDIGGALMDMIGNSLGIGSSGVSAPGASAAPSSSEMADAWFSPVENNIPPAIDEGMESIGQGAKDAIASSDVGTDFAAEIDRVLASNIGGITLQEFSRQIGLKISEAMIAGLSATGGEAVPGSTGTTPITGIGEQIATALNGSLVSADFSEVGTTIQSKISEAISSGLSAEGGSADNQAAGAAGSIGSSIASALAGSIGSADFAAVGAALQAKIGSSLISGVAEGGQGAGGQVAGAAGGLGASIAQGLASSIGSADFSAVGAAIQSKITEAITAGQASSMGGPGERGGGGGGLGASIAASIAADVAAADFSAIGEAISTQIGATLASTQTLNGAMTTMVDAAVAAGVAASSGAVSVGTQLATFAGSGAAASQALLGAVQSMVAAAIAAGMSAISSAVEIGTQLATFAGSGAASSQAFSGGVTTMVSAAVAAGVAAAAPAVEIGQMVATHAGSGAAAATELNGAVETMVGAAIDAGVAAASGASVIGAAISEGAASGVDVFALNGVVEQMVLNGIQAGKDAAAISSPSKVAMLEIGEPIVEGIVVGIRRKRNDLKGALSEIINNAVNVGQIYLPENMFDGLLAIGETLKNMPGMEHFGQALLGLGADMSSAATEVNDATEGMIADLTSTLENAAGAVAGSSQSISDALKGGFGKDLRNALGEQWVDASNLIGGLGAMEQDVDQLIAIGNILMQKAGFENIGKAILTIAENIDTARINALAEAQSMMDNIESLIATNEQKIRKAAKKAGEAPGEEVSKKMRESKKDIGAASTEMATSAASGMQGDNLDRLIGIAQQFGAQVGTAIQTGAAGALAPVELAGEELAGSFETGLTNGQFNVGEAAEGSVGTAREVFETGSAEAVPDVETAGLSLGQAFLDGISNIDTASDAIALVTQLHSGITQAVTERLGTLQQAGKSVGDAFSSGIDGVNPTQVGSSLVNEAGNGITQGTPPAIGTATRSGELIGTALEDGIDATCTDVNTQATDLTDSCVPQGIEAGEKTATNAANTAGENTAQALIDGLEIKKNDVKGKFDAAGDLFGSAIGEGIGSKKTEAGNATQSVVNAGNTQQIKESATNTGKGLGSMVGKGIGDGITGETEYVKKAVAAIIDAAKAEADKKSKEASPSKLFMETGRNISLGVAIGIDQEAMAVADSTANLISIVSQGMEEFGNLSMTRAFDLGMDRYSKSAAETMDNIERRARIGAKTISRNARIRESNETMRGRVVNNDRSQPSKTIQVGDIVLNPGDPGYNEVSGFIDTLQTIAGQY